MDNQDQLNLDDSDRLWTEGLRIVSRIEDAGYRAYLVGGCVRDRLIGRSIHDIDIATSAKPEEVMALFTRTVPTGIKHGTVTVLEDGQAFEVTTFRQEAGYSDSRRPDSVAFVQDVREDLARRDFTFNAMAVGSNGEVVDPFGGQDALRAGVVDCVGDASERFNEDALRMLRAIRFASEFDFELLPDVWQGIIHHRAKLTQVAMERVSTEWDKMMSGGGPEQACHYLFKSGLLAHVKEPLPEAFLHAAERYRFNELSWEWDKWGLAASDESLTGNLARLPLLTDPDLRWAALFIGMGISERDSVELCRTLCISSRRSARISGIVGLNEQLSGSEYNSRNNAWTRAVLHYGRSLAEDWITIHEAGGDLDGVLVEQEWLNELAITSVSELDVRGDELVSYLGHPPGPWIASMLQHLLELVAVGEIPNDKGSLLLAAKESLANREL